jgi:hypothetical protein
MANEDRDPHGLVPDTSKTVLLILDLISDFEFEDGEKIFRAALPVAMRILRLKQRARAAGIPAVYVNDGAERSSPAARGRRLLRLEAEALRFFRDTARYADRIYGRNAPDLDRYLEQSVCLVHGKRCVRPRPRARDSARLHLCTHAWRHPFRVALLHERARRGHATVEGSAVTATGIAP